MCDVGRANKSVRKRTREKVICGQGEIEVKEEKKVESPEKE
jgi:hypothetical protein